jgi:hypothetical protein
MPWWLAGRNGLWSEVADHQNRANDLGGRENTPSPHMATERWDVTIAAPALFCISVSVGCRAIGLFVAGLLHPDRVQRIVDHPRISNVGAMLYTIR